MHASRRDRQGMVTQVKEVILLPINNTDEVMPDMGLSSPSVTYGRNQMQQLIEEGLAKSSRNLNISSNSPTTYVGQHASNSSATQHHLQNAQFGMSLNYFLVKHLQLEPPFLIEISRRVPLS
jgi:hypothetical protein